MRWALVVALTAAYPLLVFAGLGHVEPRTMALLLLVLGLLRMTVGGQGRAQVRWVVVAALLLAGLTVLVNRSLPLKLYPVLVNAAMFAVFALSLWRGPTVIERLARLTDPELPPEAIRYTRRVTQVWCGFFVLNGLIALGTALWASERVWALYSGLIAYLLMGLLMGGEWLLRRRVRARMGA
ncbi:hypothetical protein FUT87_11285 [Mitsuaria sp. TWR114]|jgi:uncharacterized membrane protein|uniref:COG4648 family protein n=1 Tax=unclassified Roseateles TaxID=2626991 RepID=UPI0011BD96A1|nr:MULTISPECIES: hypothetical protein [unclassified Roseateles]MBB3295066.1 putative membrane protein [Mitsuaria sp. BK041]MBB3364282.1 putative membrane protein [Mitsuaria sp. BK045]TXD89537.1 hypothetical protein FUT87_11285 [Mitsuaria sp. TWR114]